VKLKELNDFDLIRNFIVSDNELWNRVSEDGNNKEDFIISENPFFWWIGCYSKSDVLVGIFWMHQTSSNICLQVHAHVKKEHREQHAYECGENTLIYFVEKMPKKYVKLIAEIPEIYQDVIHFTLKFGMKKEGVNRLSYKKDDKIIDQCRFGITREEAKLWLQQQ